MNIFDSTTRKNDTICLLLFVTVNITHWTQILVYISHLGIEFSHFYTQAMYIQPF